MAQRASPVSDAARSVARHGGTAPTRWNRLTNGAYFTIDAPWVIPALLSKVKIVGPVLDIASPRHNFIWAIWNATPRPRGTLPWVQFAARRQALAAASPSR